LQQQQQQQPVEHQQQQNLTGQSVEWLTNVATAPAPTSDCQECCLHTHLQKGVVRCFLLSTALSACAEHWQRILGISIAQRWCRVQLDHTHLLLLLLLPALGFVTDQGEHGGHGGGAKDNRRDA
jgi:hypothetical protein